MKNFRKCIFHNNWNFLCGISVTIIFQLSSLQTMTTRWSERIPAVTSARARRAAKRNLTRTGSLSGVPKKTRRSRVTKKKVTPEVTPEEPCTDVVVFNPVVFGDCTGDPTPPYSSDGSDITPPDSSDDSMSDSMGDSMGGPIPPDPSDDSMSVTEVSSDGFDSDEDSFDISEYFNQDGTPKQRPDGTTLFEAPQQVKDDPDIDPDWNPEDPGNDKVDWSGRWVL